MALSPAQRFHARKLAQKAAASAAAAPAGARELRGAPASEYELLRARLGVDLRRLKTIQATDRKIEAKREMIAAYLPWVEGVIDAGKLMPRGKAEPDDIVIHMMIWALDLQDYAVAFPIVEHVLAHDLPLPERFSRTAPALIVEEIADAALKRLGQGEDADIEPLLLVEDLTADHDMHDEIRAKLLKAIGLQIVRDTEKLEPGADGPAGGRRAGVETALRYLRLAYGHSHTAGVKKDIDRLEREARKLAAEAATPPA
ncbi:phage terminase small subunit [Flavisphingomonas formosensis]|uniref:phage terminase small subunit n=1 Tax=Flavisphingomonas formosensis TaxID=861534 RepID=UPI0012F926BB|nr:phage terminase small subunit [Sphingomonas formosensis]